MDMIKIREITDQDRRRPLAQFDEAPSGDAIRPFRVNIPEEALVDIRRRLAGTHLPEKEAVSDYSQGGTLKTVQQLPRHWQTGYDWGKVEARLARAHSVALAQRPQENAP